MIDREEDKVKISFIGPEDAGKTTSIKQLSSKFLTVSPRGKTIAIDFGKYKYDDSVYLFGVPGDLRFKFVIKVGIRGSDGIVIVVDSSDPNVDQLRRIYEVVKDVIENDNVIVFANKQDLPDALPPKDVKGLIEENLGIPNPPTVGTIAVEGEGLREGIEKLLDMIRK
ncbi:ADP-ribosylation factor-like protein [Methanopyrus sp.]